MSKVYNPALQERLENYLATSGISQAKLAPKVGISQTALSQYRRSKYDNGDIAELERKLEEFFRTEEAVEAAAVKAAPYGIGLPRQNCAVVPISVPESDIRQAIYRGQLCLQERKRKPQSGEATAILDAAGEQKAWAGVVLPETGHFKILLPGQPRQAA